MAKTSIEWTDHSTNPIRARNKITGAVLRYTALNLRENPIGIVEQVKSLLK